MRRAGKNLFICEAGIPNYFFDSWNYGISTSCIDYSIFKDKKTLSAEKTLM